MTRTSAAAALLAVAAAVSLSTVAVSATPRHTGIILLGGMGDLARKYVWQALFDAYMRREVTEGMEGDSDPQPWTFTLVAGGASHASVAANRLKVGVARCFFKNHNPHYLTNHVDID